MSEQPNEAEMSKSALKKLKKKQEKEQKKQENQQKQAQPTFEVPKLTVENLQESMYGDYPLHQSQTELAFSYPIQPLSTLNDPKDEIRVRAYVHNVRSTGKSAFMVLREGLTTLQAVSFGNAQMAKYIATIPKESFVEVHGCVVKAEQEVKFCSIHHLEMQIKRIYAISHALKQMPIQVEDASRPESLITREAAVEENDGEKGDEKTFAAVSRETLFNARVIHLRVPSTQAILRIRMKIQTAFSEFLAQRNFLQVTSPKIIPGVSEGGASAFTLKYFGKDACLAQSPQLYKQMAVAGGLQRVFEIGPVFRAENSHTHRHLCEFTGLDLEMQIDDSYHEVMKLLHDLLVHIISTVQKDCVQEIGVIRTQFDVKEVAPAVWTESPVIVDFREGCKWLREAGYEQADEDDLNTMNERALGKIVRERLGTDLYILDKFPEGARPFYTMLDPADPRFTNSYDVFLRGEEICSGAQRIHNPELLLSRLEAKGVPAAPLSDYVDAFRFGCPPHAGAGLGLERIVMLLIGLDDCRQCCLFPRTPERLAP